MSDPARLCEDVSSDGFERALLRSASLDRAPEDGAIRALAALGVATAALGAGSAGMSTTTHAAGAAGAGITKVVAGIVTTMLIAGAVIANARSRESATPARIPSAQEKSVEAIPALEVTPRVAPEPSSIAVADLPSAPSIAGKAPSVRAPGPLQAATSAPAAPKGSVADELALIDRARASIRAGETSHAEQALDTYDARFAKGALVVEAKLARIELHLARGENTLARTLGERFLLEHPRTAYGQRVRALLRRAGTEPTIVQ